MKNLTKKLPIALFAIVFNVQNSFAEAPVSSKKSAQELTFFYLQPSQQGFERIQQGFMQAKDIPKHNLGNLIIWAKTVSDKYHWTIAPDFFPTQVAQLNNKNSTISKFINNDNAVTPQKLDIWWATFFATGDSKPVRKIFNHAQKPIAKEKPKTQKELKSFLITRAAKWSFKSNCKKHEKIRTFASEWQNDSDISAEGKKLLNKCINSK